MPDKITLEVATELLHKNTMNVNLRRHGYAVAIAMRAIHDYLRSIGKTDGSVEDLAQEDWGVVGLLHDADYEITSKDTSRHTLEVLNWLKEFEVHMHIINAIQSHNHKMTGLRPPQTLLEWSLECCDELTGFIVACALVQPDKKLASVDLESVKKKWKMKEFARNVDRSQIEQCKGRLGIELDDFIQVILKAMQLESGKLGL